MFVPPTRSISENISILMFGLSNTLSRDSPLKNALSAFMVSMYPNFLSIGLSYQCVNYLKIAGIFTLEHLKMQNVAKYSNT